jgi:hypothetical protein
MRGPLCFLADADRKIRSSTVRKSKRRLDLTEAAFNQEDLALFVNWEGSVF